jgi:hypothetical protein
MSAHKSTQLSERAALAADRVQRIVDLDAQILELECSLNSLREARNVLQGRLATYTYLGLRPLLAHGSTHQAFGPKKII